MSMSVDKINNTGAAAAQGWLEFGYVQLNDAFVSFFADSFMWYEIAFIMVAICGFLFSRANFFRPYFGGKNTGGFRDLSKDNSRICTRRWGSPEPGPAQREFKRSNSSRTPPPANHIVKPYVLCSRPTLAGPASF